MKKLPFVIVGLLISISSFAQTPKDTLIVGYSQAAPFIINNDGKLSGINIWLWNRVAQDLDINYKLVRMDFSEMLDGLKNESIDLCINPLTNY